MAYNHRASQQFHGGQHQNRSNNRKKEDDSDALMRLVGFCMHTLLPLPPTNIFETIY